MKIKIDDNLKKVAAAINLDAMDLNIFSTLLCKKMIVAGLLADDPANYGLTVILATGDAHVFDVVSVLIEYLGIPAMKMETFDAFCECVVMGDGDCPECGGELEYCETEGRELHDGDYYVPNSFIAERTVYRCRECGSLIKIDE